MANPFETSLNPFDDYNEGRDAVIKEGLLCPFSECLQEFKTVAELHEHYNSVHVDEEKKNFSSQLKGFIGKAKKILKREELESIERSVAQEPVSYFYHAWREVQECGPSRNHFSDFQKIRDSRIERYVIETNKLLIRLDKLLRGAPSDPEKRKQHEKNVVQWISDADVRLCPGCAKSFNISRRRHHCRLCGGVLCHSCSQFLESEYAIKLVGPTNLEAVEYLALPSQGSGLQRRGSNSSLVSVVSSTGNPHIRVCRDCKVLLDRRNQQVEDQLCKPILLQIYERLKDLLNEADKVLPIYHQMCDSFSKGENTYQLRDAQELRIKIMRLAESIDGYSRRIAKLGMQEEQTPSATQCRLQNSIRMAITHYLREHMLGLPSLPTEEQLAKLQEKRMQEIQRQIEEEKRARMEAEARKRQPSPNTPRQTSSKMNKSGSSELVSPDSGWGPDFMAHPNCDLDDMDPVLIQINIIKNYIKKAREEHKYDEVNTLEQNLKELQISYMLQQQELNSNDE